MGEVAQSVRHVLGDVLEMLHVISSRISMDNLAVQGQNYNFLG